MPTPTTSRRPTVRLRDIPFREACAARGLVTDSAKAVAIGVSRAQIIRASTGQAAAGGEFIAAVLSTFGVDRFADFFAVTR